MWAGSDILNGVNSSPPPAGSAKPRGKRLTAPERRESILRAATEVFSETGYLRGRTSLVAARAGVSEPVIFNNFGTKPALYAAVLERAVESVCRTLREAVLDGESVPQVLGRFLEPAHVERFHRPGATGFLFADASTLTSDPGVGEAAGESLRGFAAELAELLRQGQTAGGIRPGINADAAAWWLLSMVATRAFRATAMPGADGLEADLTAMTLATLTTDI
ncbi:transcriptional regulator, TetR family [Streptomyces sp. AmelKG-E11A]|nr:TetR/AcrR family transcriptional regulator [Streptomyces sp. SID4919]SCK55148.1 transcriptional regulator, TetR family [Streptomyces sp. AmelKG-E11A]